MHHLALLSLAICAPSARAAQDPASTVDLEALTAALRPAEEWFVLGPPLSPYRLPPEEAQQKPWLANGQEVDGDVADILRFRLPELAATLVEGAGEHDSSDAAAAEARAARLLERWATRRWCVDLIELPREVAATLESALLSPSDVDSLLAQFPDVATRTTLATPRRAARFDERRRWSYIQDFNIEVSDGLHPDPTVGVARFGRDTRVRVHSRSRTSHFVDVCTSGGEPDGPGRTLRIFEGEWPLLDLPEAVHFAGAASAVVADGGALVLAPCGVDGGVTLVRVTRVDDGPEDVGTASIGLGGFANVRHSWPADELPGPLPSGGWSLQRETIHGVHEELFPGLELELSELLTSVRVEWRTLGLLGCAVPLGAEVFAAGEPEALALLRERARVANRTGEHTYSFDLRFGDVPADVVRGLVVGTPLAEAAAARLVDELGAGGRFLGVAAAGGGALWTDAHQTSFVQDCDIELGMSGISLPDPYVGLLTTGVSAACSARPMHAASPTLGNRLLVSLELRRRAPLGPIRQVRALTAPYGAPDTSGPVVVTLDLPESELRSLALTLPVVPARWTLVDLATRGARAEVVLVRVSELPTPW